MIVVLRQRNFVLLFSQSLISSAGDWVLYAAVPYAVYVRTGSALATSLTFVLEITPSVLFGTIGGVLADRWDRKRAIVIAQLCMGASLVPALTGPQGLLLPLLYAGVLGVALCSQVAGPASSAALPLVVPKDDLVAANSALSAANNIARIIGSALGGAVVVAAGLRVVVAIDALSFWFAAGCVALVSVRLQGTDRTEGTAIPGVWQRSWREWQEGMALVVGRRWISIAFLVLGIAVFGDGMFTVAMVPFVRHTLHASALVFAWALTVRGLGGLLGTLVVPLIAKHVGPRRLIGWSAVVDGIIVVSAGALASVPALLVLTLLVGTPVVGFYVGLPTLLQEGVEDEFRGRVFGAFGAVGQLMALLGMLSTGFAVGKTDVLPWVYMSGALYLLAGALALRCLTSIPAQTANGERGRRMLRDSA